MQTLRSCAAGLWPAHRGQPKKRALLCACTMLLLWTCVVIARRRLGPTMPSASAEQLPLFRDVYAQEDWPDIEQPPGLAPDWAWRTVHYVWCGSKQFRFQHYLSVLSAVRLLRPLKVVIHYTHLPVVDDLCYNVWFQELKQSFANLELERLVTFHACGSRAMLDTAINFLSRGGGGIYIGENVVLTRFPHDVTNTSLWSATAAVNTSSDAAVTQAVVFVKDGYQGGTRTVLDYISSLRKGVSCRDVENYDAARGSAHAPPCIVLDRDVFPRDIWGSNTSFARLARWLYYGTRETRQVQPTADGKSIPRIAHLTWFNHDGRRESTRFRFLHFLSVLSALYVADFRHVYVHGDLEPRGLWWARLAGENVTFVTLDPPRGVFQQRVRSLSHRSDLIRVQVLQQHGGVYQDRDVVWTGRPPDWLLRYPAVLSPDWPRNGEWPSTISMGVIMAQARAPWLRHFRRTLRHFLDGDHAFNAIMMPYRTYERHPETAYLDRRLQVICFRGICHPAWHDDYIRDIDDRRAPRDFRWQEGRAFHFTVPKPPPSLLSPAALARGSDLFAQIGTHVLLMAGRQDVVG